MRSTINYIFVTNVISKIQAIRNTPLINQFTILTEFKTSLITIIKKAVELLDFRQLNTNVTNV